MKTPRLFFAFAISLSVFSIGRAQDSASENIATEAEVAEYYRYSHERNVENLATEFGVTVAEYRAGRSPIHVVLKMNQRLLSESLAAGIPDAAISYDKRAATVESIAQKMLDKGSGTKAELARASKSRLDAILKSLLERSIAK